ncbi:MAG: pseudouridine-5'-phosphate glycosidase [Candidatus Krumholzibacteriia bacterium]
MEFRSLPSIEEIDIFTTGGLFATESGSNGSLGVQPALHNKAKIKNVIASAGNKTTALPVSLPGVFLSTVLIL